MYNPWYMKDKLNIMHHMFAVSLILYYFIKFIISYKTGYIKYIIYLKRIYLSDLIHHIDFKTVLTNSSLLCY